MSRRRLSARESRAIALEAARELLVEEGPQAVTLKAIAARVNRTHANLLHHFGSAAGLQLALANYLATSICDDIAIAAQSLRLEPGDGHKILDFVFETFSSRGVAALATWMLCSGQKGALDPVVEAVQELIDQSLPEADGQPLGRGELTYLLLVMALGVALVGNELSAPLAIDIDVARQYGKDLFATAFARRLVS